MQSTHVDKLYMRWKKHQVTENSLIVQWWGLHASTAGGIPDWVSTGSVPGWELGPQNSHTELKKKKKTKQKLKENDLVPHKKTHQVTNYALHGDLNNIRNPCGFKLFQKIRNIGIFIRHWEVQIRCPSDYFNAFCWNKLSHLWSGGSTSAFHSSCSL